MHGKKSTTSNSITSRSKYANKISSKLTAPFKPPSVIRKGDADTTLSYGSNASSSSLRSSSAARGNPIRLPNMVSPVPHVDSKSKNARNSPINSSDKEADEKERKSADHEEQENRGIVLRDRDYEERPLTIEDQQIQQTIEKEEDEEIILAQVNSEVHHEQQNVQDADFDSDIYVQEGDSSLALSDDYDPEEHESIIRIESPKTMPAVCHDIDYEEGNNNFFNTPLPPTVDKLQYCMEETPGAQYFSQLVLQEEQCNTTNNNPLRQQLFVDDDMSQSFVDEVINFMDSIQGPASPQIGNSYENENREEESIAEDVFFEEEFYNVENYGEDHNLNNLHNGDTTQELLDAPSSPTFSQQHYQEYDDGGEDQQQLAFDHETGAGQQQPVVDDFNDLDAALFDEPFTLDPRYLRKHQLQQADRQEELLVNDMEEQELDEVAVTAAIPQATLQPSGSACSSESAVLSHGGTTDKHSLAFWGLPVEVQEAYKKHGVHKLYPWQAGCLEIREVTEGGANLIYSAPTSGGKTLVAEILMLRRILQYPGKRCLFILPFVSIVEEKVSYLTQIFEQSMGVVVRGHYANKGGHMGSGEEAEEISVCTIEKANSIVNHLIEEGRIDELGMVVVDEIHMIGDRDRGYLLELLLTKLIYMNAGHVQVVGLSATLPNVNTLATWLNAYLFLTNFRPVPLHEFVKVGGQIFNSSFDLVRTITRKTSKDPDYIVSLCEEVVLDGHSALIFCATKKACETCAKHIANLISQEYRDPKLIGNEIQKARMTIVEQMRRTPTGLDPQLEYVILKGVAYHHAGLTVEERELIEKAYRDGTINVLTCTTTLSAGVNLPARRVIFRSLKVGLENLDVIRYKQAAGRAGRAGKDTYGESVIICSEKEKEFARSLLNSPLPMLNSCLTAEKRGMTRALLEVVASGVVSRREDISRFIRCTLLAAQRDYIEVHKTTCSALQFLEANDFMKWVKDKDGEASNRNAAWVATQLGKATFASALSPEEGLIVYKHLEKARSAFVLNTELHIVYLVTPTHHEIQPNWNIYLQLYQRLPSNLRHVADLVGVTESYLVRATQKNPGYLNTDDATLVHKRFFAALALHELIMEVSISSVSDKYQIERGQLQKLQSIASTFSGMVSQFCERLKWWQLQIMVGQLKDRLNHGVQMDILPLVQIPQMKAHRARALYQAGYRTVESIAMADPEEIEALFTSKLAYENKNNKEGSAEVQSAIERRIVRMIIKGAQDLIARNSQEQNYRMLTTNPNGSPSKDTVTLISPTTKGTPPSTLATPPRTQRRQTLANSAVKQLPFNSYTQAASPSLPVTARVVSSTKAPSPAKGSGQPTPSKSTASSSSNPKKRVLMATTFSSPKKPKQTQGPVRNTGRQQRQTPAKPKSSIPQHSVFTNKRGANAFDITEISLEQEDDFHALLAKLESQKEYAFQLHFSKGNNDLSSATNIVAAKVKGTSSLHGIAFSFEETNAFFVHLSTKSKDRMHGISQLLRSDKSIKISYQLKTELVVLLEHSIEVGGSMMDPQIADWILNPVEIKEAPSLDVLSKKHLQKNAITFTPQNNVERVCKQAVQTLILMKKLKELLKFNKLEDPFLSIEMPLVPVLAHMEYWGMGLELSVFTKYSEHIKNKLLELEHDVFDFDELRGKTRAKQLSLSSPADVAEILYDFLKLPEPSVHVKKSKATTRTSTNGRSTAADVLEKLKDLHPIVPLIMEYRRLSTLNNKYMWILPKHAVMDTRFNMHRIFCTIEQTNTATGRLATHSPNLQTIPHPLSFTRPGLFISNGIDDQALYGSDETAICVNLRNAFVAAPGYVLLSADYSQIEVRLLSHFSDDAKLKQALESSNSPGGTDIFVQIAARLSEKPESAVTKEDRDHAKRVTYGILYGMGGRALSDDLDITYEEAITYINTFRNKYHGVGQYMEHVYEKCKKNGYVETIKGRKRYFKDVYSGNPQERAKVQRQTLNTICQGSAADLIKVAMIAIHDRLRQLDEQIAASSRHHHYHHQLRGGPAAAAKISSFTSRINNSKSVVAAAATGAGQQHHMTVARMILQIHDELLFEVKQEHLATVKGIVSECMSNAIKLSVPLPVRIKVGQSWGSMQ